VVFPKVTVMASTSSSGEANASNIAITSSTPGSVSMITGIFAFDSDMLCDLSPDRCPNLSDASCLDVRETVISGDRKISGEEMEESVISSRTSNHRPARLMELFGN